MSEHVRKYWGLRLEAAAEALRDNNFEAEVAADSKAAVESVLNKVLPESGAGVVGLGGSMTVVDSGLYKALKGLKGVELLDSYDKSLSPEASIALRRRALTSDLLVTGSNAVTEDGMLVNLDGTGNRVAALAFGPKKVVILAGRNKLVPDLEDAISRIKNVAAPINSMRLNRKTPCAKTGRCHDCSAEGRICSVWSIMEKSWPKGRVHVILINQDMGF